MPASWNPYETLSEEQRRTLEAFEALLLRFNRHLNLISSSTEAAFEERHLLHSLALTKKSFPPGSVVVDWGTGGGLPAIPLAICFPDVTIHAVDSVRKKIQTVRAIGRRLGLTNLYPWHGRAERWEGSAQFSVSRATAPLLDLWAWHHRVADPGVPESTEEVWMPGLICLKGGDLSGEIRALQASHPSVVVDKEPLTPLLGRAYFAEKFILEVRNSES